nr:MAG TPA: hypothetical protein [Caudoviricetes sp.]
MVLVNGQKKVCFYRHFRHLRHSVSLRSTDRDGHCCNKLPLRRPMLHLHY